MQDKAGDLQGQAKDTYNQAGSKANVLGSKAQVWTQLYFGCLLYSVQPCCSCTIYLGG